MNNLDKTYTDLLKDILENGTRKGDRTGTGTISVFGRQIRHKMSDGFPLLTTKKMYMKGIITELIWFLRGDTSIEYLLKNDCNIWTGDAYKNYCNDKNTVGPLTMAQFIEEIKTNDEFAKKWGDLGPVYGKQWRDWTYLTREQKEDIDGIDELICGADMWDSIRYYRTFDQIANLIHDLKTNPDSRRLMVNAWNVGELDSMVLPPCHYGFQIYTRELSLEERVSILGDIQTNDNGYYEHSYAKLKCDEHNVPTRAISLMWNQRSVDTFLGLPFNIASYGLLLEIIAKVVNMVPDELIGNLGDVHLYSNHVEQATEQIGRELTKEERKKLYENEFTPGMEVKDDEWLESKLVTRNIPKRTREPYPLPKLGFNKSSGFFRELSDDLSLLNHLDISDFMVENYQSHSTIKAPLSN